MASLVILKISPCYVAGGGLLMTFPQETPFMHQWRVTYFHGYKCCEWWSLPLLPSNSNHTWCRKREESGFTRINLPIFCPLQNAGAQAALQAAQQLMCASGGVGGMDEPKTVLRVIIEHMLYPVTIDVLKQVRFTLQIKLTNVVPINGLFDRVFCTQHVFYALAKIFTK